VDVILAALGALKDQKAQQQLDVTSAAAAVPPVPAAPPPVAPPSASGTRPKKPQAAAPEAAADGAGLQSIFQDGNSLVRAIIASEVLGAPVSLRENHHWNQPPNEPST
jgi:hypothetical protein